MESFDEDCSYKSFETKIKETTKTTSSKSEYDPKALKDLREIITTAIKSSLTQPPIVVNITPIYNKYIDSFESLMETISEELAKIGWKADYELHTFGDDKEDSDKLQKMELTLDRASADGDNETCSIV